MNYQDYIKYDPEKKQYTDSYGYVIDGYTSKALPSELATAAEAISIANGAAATAAAAAASIGPVSGGNFQTVTAGYGLTNQLAITTVSGTATLTPSGTDANINVTINPKGGDGSLKVAANYAKYISIMGGGNTKITTSQGTNADSDLTLESKGAGKLILANDNNGNTFETLEIEHANGSSTITTKTQFPATYPKGDIILVPRGIGIVDCKSYTAEWNTGMGSTQTLGTNVNTKVTYDNLMSNNFPAGFITESGGWNTFQNTCGRTIALMVTACIRETTFPTGRTLGLWIARSGDSTLQYGQALLPPTTDTTNGRALNTASIIKLANNETFSIWAHSAVAGVVIGGNGALYNRPILSYRLMP